MESSDALLQLVPLLLIGCIIGALMARVASKLGRSKLLWFILGATPGVNFFFLWVAIWVTIIRLTRRVNALEQKLNLTEPPQTINSK